MFSERKGANSDSEITSPAPRSFVRHEYLCMEIFKIIKNPDFGAQQILFTCILLNGGLCGRDRTDEKKYTKSGTFFGGLRTGRTRIGALALPEHLAVSDPPRILDFPKKSPSSTDDNFVATYPFAKFLVPIMDSSC